MSHNNIAEMTLVVPDIDSNLMNKLELDLQRFGIQYNKIGLIENHGIFTINSIFMPEKKVCIDYVNSLNYLMNKWKDYEPYFDEGGNSQS